MTTLLEVVTFIKLQLRITSTSEDNWLEQSINHSQLRYARRKQWPQLRATGTFTVDATPTQSYALATDFDRLIDGGVRYYLNSNTQIFLDEVSQNDAELYRGLNSVTTPAACQVIAGTTGATKKLQLLPTFTETGKVVEYGYLKKPATLSADADVLALPELDEAICFDVCSLYMDYIRDNGNLGAIYAARAKRCYFDALSTMIQQ